MRLSQLLISFLTLYSAILRTNCCLNGLHVVKNQILNQYNEVVQLRGVDRSGTEYACIQGWGIFDGPNDQTSIDAMKTWNINVVRVPLNEDCWLAINSNSSYIGPIYQQSISDFVDLLIQNNMAVILDLHWIGPGTTQACCDQSGMPMPDNDHAPDFWISVANTFKNRTSVIFDLFNEPWPDNNVFNSTEAWDCWKNGNTCTYISYTVAGMQTLVNAVRSTGAQNIVMLGGIAYSNSLTEWLQYVPDDPTGNIAASWHSYDTNYCNNQNCWDTYIKPVASQYPVITGELGESDCNTIYINPLMQYLDSNQIHYLAWTWDAWTCTGGPCVISDYTGTPTVTYGQGYSNHLLSVVSSNPYTNCSLSISSTPTSLNSSNKKNTKSTPVAAIVGSVVGASAVILLGVFGFWYWRKRNTIK